MSKNTDKLRSALVHRFTLWANRNFKYLLAAALGLLIGYLYALAKLPLPKLR